MVIEYTPQKEDTRKRAIWRGSKKKRQTKIYMERGCIKKHTKRHIDIKKKHTKEHREKMHKKIYKEDAEM